MHDAPLETRWLFGQYRRGQGAHWPLRRIQRARTWPIRTPGCTIRDGATARHLLAWLHFAERRRPVGTCTPGLRCANVAAHRPVFSRLPFGALRCPSMPFGAAGRIRCPSMSSVPFGAAGRIRCPSMPFQLGCPSNFSVPFDAFQLGQGGSDGRSWKGMEGRRPVAEVEREQRHVRAIPLVVGGPCLDRVALAPPRVARGVRQVEDCRHASRSVRT